MVEKFTVDGFREKLVTWAIDKEVKYVPGNVYHMLLLREPDVAEFMVAKGYKPDLLADAIEESLDKVIESDGKSWVGNSKDDPYTIREFKEILRLQSEADEDPLLKGYKEEEDFFEKKMKLVAEIKDKLRFAEDEEQSLTDAKYTAKMQGRDLTAFDVYKEINQSFTSIFPDIYKAVGLGDYGSKNIFRQESFWTLDKPELAAGFSSNVGEVTKDPAQKLTDFLQANPDSADYLRQLIKLEINTALDERLGPTPSGNQLKPDAP